MRELPSEALLSRAGPERLTRGSVVGRYVVLEVLGEGATGVVYAAHDPGLDRIIALKLLRADVSTPRARQQLLREAQALARLQHPNVTAVHDVGTVGDEVFVAVERINGTTLARWLEQPGRGEREILAAFLAAGRGLAAAHAAGLVHRDFKPENVLVGKDGRVFVTDFGVARWAEESNLRARMTPMPRRSPVAAGGGDLEQTRPVGQGTSGTLVGTPAYMAPEQLAIEPVDARSDQFSFCVALFEALAGAPPFTRESVPLLFEQIRAGVLTPTRKIRPRLLRILKRGLSFKGSDRYPSMDALLAELDRSSGRRRTVLGVTAAAVVLGLLAGWAVVRATPAAPALCSAGPEQAGPWDAPARKHLAALFQLVEPGTPFENLAAALDGYSDGWTRAQRQACQDATRGSAQAQATALLQLACLQRRREELGAVIEVLSRGEGPVLQNSVKAVSTLTPTERCAAPELSHTPAVRLAPEDLALVEALRPELAHARALYEAGQYDDAALGVRKLAARLAGHATGSFLAETELLLGKTLIRAGRPVEARAELEQAAIAAEEVGDDELLAQAWIHFGTSIARTPTGVRDPSSASWLRYAQAAVHRLGDPPVLAWQLHQGLGLVWNGEGKAQESVREFEQALGLAERVFGADGLGITGLLQNLGVAYQALGRYDDAERVLTRSLQIRLARLGPMHPDVATAYQNLSVAHGGQGKNALCLEEDIKVLEIRKASLPLDHPEIAMALANVAADRVNLGQTAEVTGLYEAALTILERRYGKDHRLYVEYQTYLAQALSQMGQHAAAEQRLRDSYERGQRLLGKDHPDVVFAQWSLGHEYLQLHAPAQALPLLEDAVARYGRIDAEPADFADARRELAEALVASGRDPARARALMESSRQTYEKLGAARKVQLGELEKWLAEHPPAVR